MRNHTDDRPYVCPKCNKGFTRFKNLRYHLNVHTDVNQYFCNECSKNFKHPSSLRKHKEMHHAIEPAVYKN